VRPEPEVSTLMPRAFYSTVIMAGECTINMPVSAARLSRRGLKKGIQQSAAVLASPVTLAETGRIQETPALPLEGATGSSWTGPSNGGLRKGTYDASLCEVRGTHGWRTGAGSL